MNNHSFVLNILLYKRVYVPYFLALPFGMVGDILATKDPDLDDDEEETHVYEKHDKLLHGDRKERK
jgi:DNA replication licensing factor MCM3